MIRIHMSGPNKSTATATRAVERCEGGWWFAETVGSKRSAFRVLNRTDIKEYECIVEVLEPLPDDFIQTPCWLEPQGFGPQGLEPLEFPFGQMKAALSLPSVVQQFGTMNKLYETVQKIIDETQTKHLPLQGLQEHSLKQSLQSLKQKEEPVLQTAVTHSASRKEMASPKKLSSRHVPQVPKVNSPSVQSKGNQTNSPCLSKNQPKKQAPRKTVNHPKEMHIPRQKNHHTRSEPTKCLIDLRES